MPNLMTQIFTKNEKRNKKIFEKSKQQSKYLNILIKKKVSNLVLILL
jgi:hypothetical protein